VSTPILSELSVTEFLMLEGMGFYPRGLVVGSCLYEASSPYDWTVKTGEITSLSQAMLNARMRAMQQVVEQAREVGADGVVDVGLELEHHLWRGARQVVKFVAKGTAIAWDHRRAHGPLQGAPSLRLQNGTPFTSDLTAQDFVTLLRAGYRPVMLAMASCVYGLDPRDLRQYRGQDTEVTTFTQAFFDAREEAMSTLQKEIFHHLPRHSKDTAAGIVGMTVSESTYGGRAGAPIIEFTALGTAIAHLDPNDPRRAPQLPRPQVVVPLDR
jgi:uncharacterized protein YbjQ (UPF0145 family)